MKNILINKKGAMFGLDARIALAIFGALSVISGAALYSAIQQSKVIALNTEMKEIMKALDAYQLDTGQTVPYRSGSAYQDMSELVESNVAGWKGPYVSNLVDGSQFLIHSRNPSTAIYTTRYTLDDFDTPEHVTSCTQKDNCGLWLIIRESSTDTYFYDVLNEFDKYIDGENDLNTGKVRYKTNGFSHYIHYLYRTNSVEF